MTSSALAGIGTSRPEIGRITENAKRLLRDAKLLSDNERYASAFALAVLGLEEIGKALLNLWGLSKYTSGHVYKQAAVSSLLIVDGVMRGAQASPEGGRRSPSSAELERIIATVLESETGRFSQSIDSKALDKVKRFAVYYDGDLERAGFDPSGFTYDDVEPIFKMCLWALNEMDHNLTALAAKSVFAVKLGRLPKR
jgi:AbiV